ncbi:MAG: phage tail protein [Pleurocapsa sp. SU_196_0]|nr:phage tail protein [Pleurocapsa sp. SU_196_0]
MKEAYASNRFYVSIDGKVNDQAVFTEVSGLQFELETFEYTEGGVNDFAHRLPGRVKGSTVTLKRGMTNSDEFLKWLGDISHGKIERKSLTIMLFDLQGKELIRWNFDRAYPVKWTGPQFQSTTNAIAIESIEFAHAGLHHTAKSDS